MPVKNRKPQGSQKPPEPELDDDADSTPSPSPPPSQERKKTKKRSLGLTFFIGGIAGLLLAGFAAKNQDSMQFISELRLDALVDVIPAGILKEATEISKQEKDAVGHESFQVGLALKAEGLTARHPVVMIPGVISTGLLSAPPPQFADARANCGLGGLESWGTGEKSRPYFRKRLWGSWSMLRAMVTDRATWKAHVMLDKESGLDPPGIKLRAAQGFDATDFFVTGYWLWSKIIENLASIGYDPTSAYTASYDWRLAYQHLELRDRYFSRLKNYIETATKLSDKKVVLVAHSMGSQVAHYFFKWVEAEGYGNGGPKWVEDNIEAFINVSGCMLGAVKGVPAVLSGEMKDTAQLNRFAVYGLEKFFSREDRAEIMRAMPGISSMLPKGGDAVWGNLTWAPDDLPSQNISNGAFIKFTKGNYTEAHANLSMSESLEYLLENSDSWFHNMIRRSYSHGVALSSAEVEANEKIPQKWVNPLESRLPLAPSLKIYCFYGIGKPTERSYYFHENKDPLSRLNVSIDTTVGAEGSDHGVVTAEGDGTVSLLSAGYMCAKGWRLKRFNPAGVKIKTYEMPHQPGVFDIRGGPNTGDHVDILGRQKLNELILRVAAGDGDSIGENIESDIMAISERVKIYDD